MPWLIEAERARAEAAILALRPEIACAKRALARAESDTDEPQPPYRTRSYASYCLNQSGKREWSVLLQIGAKQLSPRSAKRLAELERKFHGQKPEQPDGIRGGMVRSPLAGETTKFMKDDTWLNALLTFSRTRDERPWRGAGPMGGA